MTELIHSVEAVFTQDDENVLNAKYSYYYIPLYQRGYKWTSNQIIKLLEDINNFERQPGKFYCVQNITLVPNKEKKCYNVVDGQQRLTTMSLLLSVLDASELVEKKLQFPENSIRHYTNKFVKNWIIGDADLPDSWDEFIAHDSNYDHQDIYHLFYGYKTIEKWFTKNEVSKDEFKDKLLQDVKFICNVIEGEKEEKIFGNLNSKRIYLDGADLVRAILITRVTQEGAKTDTIKDIVRINERRVRIGWELDHINQWWNQSEVKAYFKPFMQLSVSGDIHFDIEKHPINQLLMLYASSKGWDSLSLENIEQLENTTKLYNELQDLHFEMVDWFTHSELYHYLGFLFHQSSVEKDFYEVLAYFRTKCKTKKDFSVYLLQKIEKDLFGDKTIDEVFEENKKWYSEEKLVPILVFLDLIEALKENRKKLHVTAFLKKDNDIEHIYPQNPSNEKDKRGYLTYLIELNPEILADSRLVDTGIKDLSEFVMDELIEDYRQKISTDSIGNLVLLYYKINRSLQNKHYAYKRKRVLDEYNAGVYIQPHTLKVFSRYFQDSESEYTDGKFWTQEDIDENENRIKKTMEEFFKNLKNENHES